VRTHNARAHEARVRMGARVRARTALGMNPAVAQRGLCTLCHPLLQDHLSYCRIPTESLLYTPVPPLTY